MSVKPNPKLRALAVGILILVFLLIACGFVALIVTAWMMNWFIGASIVFFFALCVAGSWAVDYIGGTDG